MYFSVCVIASVYQLLLVLNELIVVIVNKWIKVKIISFVDNEHGHIQRFDHGGHFDLKLH